jgi:hypothetical protein
MLKSPLVKLIPMVRSLKYKDLHIDLSEKLEEVKGGLEAGNQDRGRPIQLSAENRLLELARLDPRAAVLSAWIDVESALIDLARTAGVSSNQSPVTIASELHALDVLTELELRTFRDLRRIRNDAAHLPTLISFEEAKSMAEMCDWLSHRLREIDKGFPADLRAQASQ